MPYIDKPLEKLYYTIGEVAEILGESTSLVRFWANSFPDFIKPARNKKGNRLFSAQDVSNFKLRKGMPIGAKVTLRGTKMYEFLEKLIRVVLPRIRDFNGVAETMDGQGNYTLGIKEQIIFPEVDIDKNPRIHGLEITFVTSAKTDEECKALLAAFGIPFKKHNN